MTNAVRSVTRLGSKVEKGAHSNMGPLNSYLWGTFHQTVGPMLCVLKLLHLVGFKLAQGACWRQTFPCCRGVICTELRCFVFVLPVWFNWGAPFPIPPSLLVHQGLATRGLWGRKSSHKCLCSPYYRAGWEAPCTSLT